MDPISFSLALAGIPGIFTACVDCFEFIQFGRDCAKDFAKTLCMLGQAEMRLTRWGKAMGIDGPDARLRAEDYDEEEIVKAYEWLISIQEAFDDTKNISAKYVKRRPEQVNLLDTSTEIDKTEKSLKALHIDFRKISTQRVGIRKRVTWALYQRGAFLDLVQTLSELINNLVELFPATQELQKRLCEEEVKQMDKDSLSTLGGENGIGKDDEILKPILQVEMEVRKAVYENVEVDGYARGYYGGNFAPGEAEKMKVDSTYKNIKADGYSETHFGNNIGNYQGKTMFERSPASRTSGEGRGPSDPIVELE